MAPLPLRDRLIAGVGTVAVMAGLGTLLLSLGPGRQLVREATTTLLSLSSPPAPPPEVHLQKRAPGKAGRSSSPERAPLPKATIAAPVKVTPHVAVPVIAIAAPVPAAAPAGGSGIGAGEGLGGRGNGRGMGDDGDGEGGGGTPPEQIAGALSAADLPIELRHTFTSATVGVRYRVGLDGRASDCVITRSSGLAELDDTTCRLIEERFRFEPALDERGKPVRSSLIENHSWTIER